MNFSTIEHMPRKLTRTGRRKAFNISYMTAHSGVFNVSGEDTDVEDILVSPDGTMLYIVGNTTDTIYQYQLCIPYLPVTALLYASKDVSSETTNPTAMAFNFDGSVMYVADGGGIVYLYDLSTEYDVSTAVYSSDDDLDFTDETTDIVSISVPVSEVGGTSIIVVDNGGEIFQYPYSGEYTDTTDYAAAFLGRAGTTCIQSNSDGTKLYTSEVTVGIYTYTLGTGWDYGTISGPSADYLDLAVRRFQISIDGSKVITHTGTDKVLSYYTLGTPWDFSTASSKTDYVFSIDGNIANARFSDDGYHLLIEGYAYLYEYSLGSTWDLSTKSLVRSIYDIDSFGNPWFNSDGTTIIFVRAGSARIGTLSTPYNISTISFSSWIILSPFSTAYKGFLDVATGRVLIPITASAWIYQVFLISAPGDPTTFDITAQTTDVTSIAFSDDGNFLVALDLTSGDLLQYFLDSTFDTDAGTYQDESYDPNVTTPDAVDLSSLAGYVYVFDYNNGDISTYDLGTTTG